MNRKQKVALRYLLQYFPFTINTMLCGVLYGCCIEYYTPHSESEEPSPIAAIYIADGENGVWFAVVL